MVIEFDDFVTDIYDVLHFNFMSLFSVGRNPRNPYVKLLQFHAIKSLVFMYLNPILMSCTPYMYEGIYMVFNTFGVEICNQSMGTDIRTNGLSLCMVISSENWL